MKETGRCKVLVASGCLSQRYSAQLEKEMPEVDLFVGTGQYHRISELLAIYGKALEASARLPKRSYIDQPAFIHTEKDPRVLTGPKYSGFLKISEGCNRRCSFCIIPKIRGNVRSRTIASLVEETKRMASEGVRELNLIAQDLTEYGMEWKHRERLEMLLPELCRVERIDWIRLHYIYPDEFSDELVELIAAQPKIVKYLDMPIQHTNDRVLKQMNRRLTKRKLFSVIQKLRTKVPDIAIRTSIIVGFPGETEAEFEELYRDLDQLDLEYVGVFKYSKEEGTPAAELKDQVHPATKRKRFKRLTEMLERKSFDRNRKYIGRTVPVLVEGPSEESELLLKARMASQAQEIDGHVLINDLGTLQLEEAIAGALVEVEITEVLPPHDLVARALRVL